MRLAATTAAIIMAVAHVHAQTASPRPLQFDLGTRLISLESATASRDSFWLSNGVARLSDITTNGSTYTPPANTVSNSGAYFVASGGSGSVTGLLSQSQANALYDALGAAMNVSNGLGAGAFIGRHDTNGYVTAGDITNLLTLAEWVAYTQSVATAILDATNNLGWAAFELNPYGLGAHAAEGASGAHYMAFGENAGYQAAGDYWFALGPAAYYQAYDLLNGVAAGPNAGLLSSGHYNVFVGDSAGAYAHGNSLTSIGRFGLDLAIGTNLVALGQNAGYGALQNDVTMVGYYVTASNIPSFSFVFDQLESQDTDYTRTGTNSMIWGHGGSVGNLYLGRWTGTNILRGALALTPGVSNAVATLASNAWSQAWGGAGSGITGLTAVASSAGVAARIDASNWTIGTNLPLLKTPWVDACFVRAQFVTNFVTNTVFQGAIFDKEDFDTGVFAANALTFTSTGLVSVAVGAATVNGIASGARLIVRANVDGVALPVIGGPSAYSATAGGFPLPMVALPAYYNNYATSLWTVTCSSSDSSATQIKCALSAVRWRNQGE